MRGTDVLRRDGIEEIAERFPAPNADDVRDRVLVDRLGRIARELLQLDRELRQVAADGFHEQA